MKRFPKIKQFTKTWQFAALMGCLVGLVFFVLFYGVKTLNPTFIDWIFSTPAHDSAQHYFGWAFFKAEGWTWPPGAIKGLAYPFGQAIIFMDSIPLLAIIFKVLSPILPTTFQYFGLWTLACYMLMGGLSALCIRHFTKNPLITTIGAIFFVSTPLLIFRSFWHPALAGQWIVLAGIFLLLKHRLLSRNLKKFITYWTILMVVTTLIHPYFLPITGGLLVIALAIDHKNWRKTLLGLAVPIVTAFLAFYLAGGLAVPDNAFGGGLESKAFHLDGFWNPQGFSIFSHSNYPIYTEGLAYLGLGILALAIFTAIVALVQKKHLFKPIKRKVWLPVTIVLAGFLLFALSPSIQFGDKTLFTVPWPQFVISIWNIFRACGRLVWPVYYLLMLGILVAYIRLSSKWRIWGVIILLIFAGIQLADITLSPRARDRHNAIMAMQQESNTPKVLALSPIVTTQKHLVILDGKFTGNMEEFPRMALTALYYNLTLNTGHFARYPSGLEDFQHQQIQNLKTGKADVWANLYMTTDATLIKSLANKYHIKQIEKYFFITQ
ncbi:DUF6311 domain-containing protein [Candidatus Saccharibacteria bacterium]|nr:DUF6311 domain-containing protein [Candidatus Saccharibacteria bacterium]